MIVAGIDPGLSGAIAIFNVTAGELVIHDMPTVSVLRGKKAKREVDAASLAGIFRHTTFDAVMLERVGAMPGQGVTSMFSMGRSLGVIEGVLAGCLAPYTMVTPQTWQKSGSKREGKDGARLRAGQLFPAYQELFQRVKDDGRADAALLAYYCATTTK